MVSVGKTFVVAVRDHITLSKKADSRVFSPAGGALILFPHVCGVVSSILRSLKLFILHLSMLCCGISLSAVLRRLDGQSLT